MVSKRNVLAGVALLAAVSILITGAFMRMNYTVYKGELFSFQYPRDWAKRESRGRTEKYFQVHVFAKPDEEIGFGPSIAVTVYPVKELGGKFETSRAMLEDFMSKVRKLQKYELQKDEVLALAHGVLAQDVEMIFSLRLPLYNVKARDVMIKDRLVVFQRGRQIYMISYKNTLAGYPVSAPVFKKVLRTLHFQD